MGGTNENMVEKIKEAEKIAQETVQNTKKSAASLIEEARIKANNQIKNVRRTCFSEWRDKIHETEKQANTRVAKLIEDAKKKKDDFFTNGQTAVTDVAKWLANEVISSYGD